MCRKTKNCNRRRAHQPVKYTTGNEPTSAMLTSSAFSSWRNASLSCQSCSVKLAMPLESSSCCMAKSRVFECTPRSKSAVWVSSISWPPCRQSTRCDMSHGKIRKYAVVSGDASGSDGAVAAKATFFWRFSAGAGGASTASAQGARFGIAPAEVRKDTLPAPRRLADELSAGAAAVRKDTPPAAVRSCASSAAVRKNTCPSASWHSSSVRMAVHGWRMDHRQHKEHCCGNNCISCCIKGIQWSRNTTLLAISGKMQPSWNKSRIHPNTPGFTPVVRAIRKNWTESRTYWSWSWNGCLAHCVNKPSVRFMLTTCGTIWLEKNYGFDFCQHQSGLTLAMLRIAHVIRLADMLELRDHPFFGSPDPMQFVFGWQLQ